MEMHLVGTPIIVLSELSWYQPIPTRLEVDTPSEIITEFVAFISWVARGHRGPCHATSAELGPCTFVLSSSPS